ncbi:hypothetical protein COU20_00360 [Candidatus Kaiserbacteria bacterium CG10_big_fil_rev_8_21_14_0_10_59_10]|uniref:ZIP family metal transporter n=1 Tax=Candidatus Kaiserbacteria bacterium CG10_big_fil_rev_8_21_14_0_10_59_10 TaxID=1974612 RepID=A0A2H0U8N8_9BACT|nr:MAG: hypothetical protein COU20_00360 [Candidatus Kaiserbacteria bacterium CG10_big_fil_rev_8_21_14_0_10_59_10]
MTIAVILIAAFVIMLASLAGVLFTFKALGTWMHLRLAYLTTFAAGVLAVLVWHLFEEALHEGEGWLVALSALGGVAILELLRRFLPGADAHHHHEAPMDHAHTGIDGRRLLVSDSFHHITDGFLIVPAFLVDWRLGVAASVGIFLHEVVLQIAQFFILKEAGYSNRRALALNFAVASTLLIGVFLSLALSAFETLLVILTGIAAGGFLWVIARDLVPHALVAARAHGAWARHAGAALLGVFLMVGAGALVPHELHEEIGHEGEHHEEEVNEGLAHESA